MSGADQVGAIVTEVDEEAAAENELVCVTDIEKVGEFVKEVVPVADSDRD